LSQRPTLFIYCLTLSAASILASCAAPESKPIPALAKYIEVDFSRFTKELFFDEYNEQYVKLDCIYKGTGIKPVGGLPADQYLNLSVGSPTEEYADRITVVIPKNIAGIVSSLNYSGKIRIYGQARAITVTYSDTGVKKEKLFIVADYIEKL
jgi:hypothetical protein